MDNVGDVYLRANQLKNDLDKLLRQFESGNDQSVATQQRLTGLSYELERTARQLEGLVSKIDNQTIWQRRLARLKEDSATYRMSLEKQLGHLYRAQSEEENRKRLLGGSQRDEIDSQMRERNSLEESHNMLDHILSQGRNTLSNMSKQNSILKGAKKKVLDIASSVGLSDNLLSVISRRQSVDCWLVIGGILVTLAVFYLSWKLFQG
eukprot:GHVL01013040.1.p1 GENE.GHVL01013040.1~~GHVL01013040.1.p1  ORF type:complete len:207 (-),score=24.80 GHVL01013040.1:230-850(-)